MTSHPDRRGLMQLALVAGALSALPAAAAEAPGDFDFLYGSWRVRHRRLKARLAGSNEWQEFGGTCVCQSLMGGLGNVDDNWLDLPAGAYRAIGVRAYDPKTRQWAIWWVDGRTPHGPLDPPVSGGFANGVGTFLSDGTHADRPVKVRYEWSKITPRTAVWEQAFSPDRGKTWEMNWHMDFTRAS